MESSILILRIHSRTSTHSRTSPLQTRRSSNELCFNWAHEHASLASTFPLCAEKHIIPPALPHTYGARLYFPLVHPIAYHQSLSRFSLTITQNLWPHDRRFDDLLRDFHALRSGCSASKLPPLRMSLYQFQLPAHTGISVVYILEVSQDSINTHQTHSYTHVWFPGTVTGAHAALDRDSERLDVSQ